MFIDGCHCRSSGGDSSQSSYFSLLYSIVLCLLVFDELMIIDFIVYCLLMINVVLRLDSRWQGCLYTCSACSERHCKETVQF